jgi:hypothetical protein
MTNDAREPMAPRRGVGGEEVAPPIEMPGTRSAEDETVTAGDMFDGGSED